MSHEAARGSSAAAPAEPSSAYLGCHSALALALYLLDILLNSAVEFGDFTAQGQSDENTQNTIITIAQVLLQIFASVNFLSLLGATFLFRSGLFGILYKQFRRPLLALPAYIVLTTVLAAIRLHHLNAGGTLADLWDLGGYRALSCLHKLCALLYYFCSVQAIEQLRDAKFYSHKHWTLTSLHKRAHGTTA